MHLLLLMHSLALAAPTGWTTRTERIVGSRSLTIVSRPAEADVVGWPDDHHERPELRLKCDRGRWELTVRTVLRVDAAGDLYDDAFATAQVRLDDAPWEPLRMRRVLDGDALQFRKPKPALADLLAAHTFGFSFVPFASPPTTTTFDLTGLEEALRAGAPSCPLPSTGR